MKQWLLSVAGIALLSVLCEAILPCGQTKKYIKTVIGVAVTYALLQPLLNFSVQLPTAATTQTQVQQQYLQYVQQTRNQDCQTLQTALLQQGLQCQVTYNPTKMQFLVQLQCAFSAQKLAVAQNVAKQCNLPFGVQFEWSG